MELTLPETPVLSGLHQVALVYSPYVRFFDRPSFDAQVNSHGREGDIVSVVGVTSDQTWLELSGPERHGWVFHEYVRLYASRAQAINALSTLERGSVVSKD